MIESRAGVQQGDPAGPALFAMALSSALERARNSFSPTLLDLWYADDGCLVGPLDDVMKGFNALLIPLSSIGLEINRNKCLLLLPKDKPIIECNIPTRERGSEIDPLVVLGFPVEGDRAAISAFIQSLVNRASSSVNTISRLRHAQGEACILRACGPTPRLRHILRFCDDENLVDWIPTADNITLECVQRIIARPCPEGWRHVAAKPPSLGGLGFPLLCDVDSRALQTSSRKSAFITITSAAERETLNSAARERLHGLAELV